MRLLNLLLTILILLSFGKEISGQGFAIFNDRNHPEIEWLTAETEHFEISYPSYLAGIEHEAASVAEESYEVLSSNLGVSFKDKIRIFLSDEDEIANGYAAPIGNGFTNIWVNVNEFADIWIGNEKWLRKVLAHELGHIFHYQATRSNIGLLGNIFGTQINRAWTEGLAQYQTEKWDAARGEKWLRTAVLEDRLSFSDGQSIWNGRLLYAVGNSQLRYFADQFGDSSLVNLFAHRSTSLFGLVKYHDFYSAMKEATGKSYREFYQDWRRHTNIYYNSVAAQLQTMDSLSSVPFPISDQYIQDLKVSPDGLNYAGIFVKSIDEPIRQLVLIPNTGGNEKVQRLHDAAFGDQISWSKDSDKIAYFSTVRGPKGSLINDVFYYNILTAERKRITRNRRASFPSYSPIQDRLVYVVADGMTANIAEYDFDTGDEKLITHFVGDTQVLSPSWSPNGKQIAFELFSKESERKIGILDLSNGKVRTVLSDESTYKDPSWSEDSSLLFLTGHKDNIPNVFVTAVEDASINKVERVTHLQNGAEILDWIPPDSTFEKGSLLLKVTSSKQRDGIYRIAAETRSDEIVSTVPKVYSSWTRHSPRLKITGKTRVREDLIQDRYSHKAIKNITKAIGVAFPYTDFSNDYGFAGLGTWSDPLGKHSIGLWSVVSAAKFSSRSSFNLSYLNRVFDPTLLFNIYRIPSTGRTYGDGILLERYTGAELFATWPIEMGARIWDIANWGIRIRAYSADPLNRDDLGELDQDFPEPETGKLLDFQFRAKWRQQKPWRNNLIHPLFGRGVQIKIAGAPSGFGVSKGYLRPEASIYNILSLVGKTRLYLYGRARAQFGKTFAQDFLYLNKYDFANINPSGDQFIFFGGRSDRVRGFRRYSFGDRVFFASAELRIPFANSLQTNVLGTLGLGAATISAFVDAGQIWQSENRSNKISQIGGGFELKNALNLGGFEISHAGGVGWPLNRGSSPDPDWYYRVRTAVPF